MTLCEITLPSQSPELPKFEVPESDGEFLDMLSTPGDATIITERWSPAHLWLRVTGEDSAGDKLSISLLENHELSEAQFETGLREILPRERLMELANHSTAVVECLITFDGSSDITTATAFPIRQLTVKNQDDVLDDFVDFNSQTLGGWEKGDAGKEIQFLKNESSGDFYLFNNTSEQLDNHDGIILQKTFPTIAGKKYKFTLDAKKENFNSPNSPMLVLRIGNSSSTAYTITNMNWSSYSFVATATSDSTTISVDNLEKKWNGNDFSMDNFRVESLIE
ncbi:hypothetical protein [Pseudomonas azerbaijanoccidentalis]|jgi:hypothetical protein